jgi:hypothetical protein
MDWKLKEAVINDKKQKKLFHAQIYKRGGLINDFQ